MRHFILIAIACLTLSGCAIWPGWSVPDANALYKESQETPAGNRCGESLPTAKGCARHLIGELSELEVDSGRWDTVYSLGMVGLGTLGAIYLKSDTDRTQAIEDLAVGVATLAGIRSVLAPDERRKVAREGREAVECMLAAAEGLQQVTGKPDTPPAPAPTPAPESAPASKSAAVSGSRVFATASEISTARTTAFANFYQAVDREFGLAPPAPGEKAAPVSAERMITGALLRARGSELKAAQEKTQTEAEIAQQNAAEKLGFGVIQVLNNVRSALSEPALSVANIVKTQRDQVQSMIGELSKSIDQENDEAKKTEGATAVVPPTPGTQAAAPPLTSTPNAAAKRQLQSVYAACVAPD